MVAMGSKLLGRWDIPDGEAYKQSEKFFYCRQLGMTYREIGERFEISGNTVRQILLKRAKMVDGYLIIKDSDEHRLGLK